MGQGEPFAFYTERHLVVLTGRRASNLNELLQHITEVSGASIFYHNHYADVMHHRERPRVYNDFAYWVSHALQDQQLGERLAAIDLLTLTSIKALRETIMSTIREHLAASRPALRPCAPGDEFHFCEAESFIMSTGMVAHDLPEFFAQLEQVSSSSLHFHFFESRLRLERPTNDFSQWLRARGEARLAKKIDNLNPYEMTLDELRGRIVRLGKKRT
jgi:hypothetical protein